MPRISLSHTCFTLSLSQYVTTVHTHGHTCGWITCIITSDSYDALETPYYTLTLSAIFFRCAKYVYGHDILLVWPTKKKIIVLRAITVSTFHIQVRESPVSWDGCWLVSRMKKINFNFVGISEDNIQLWNI